MSEKALEEELAPIKELGYALVDHLKAIRRIHEVIDGDRSQTREKVRAQIEELNDIEFTLSDEEFTRRLYLLYDSLNRTIKVFDGIESELLPDLTSIAAADSIDSLDNQLTLLWTCIDVATQSRGMLPRDFSTRVVTVKTGTTDLKTTEPIIGPVRAIFSRVHAGAVDNEIKGAPWAILARYVCAVQELQEQALKTRLAVLERTLGKKLPHHEWRLYGYWLV